MSKSAKSFRRKANPKQPELIKGKYVTRSVYQKLKEENNRLQKDIYILCHPDFDNYEKTIKQ